MHSGRCECGAVGREVVEHIFAAFEGDYIRLADGLPHYAEGAPRD